MAPKAKAKATKKPAAKRAATKRTAVVRAKAGRITSTAVTFRLTPAEVKLARECLARSGEIRYTFKDVRVTKLPHALEDGKLID